MPFTGCCDPGHWMALTSNPRSHRVERCLLELHPSIGVCHHAAMYQSSLISAGGEDSLKCFMMRTRKLCASVTACDA